MSGVISLKFEIEITGYKTSNVENIWGCHIVDMVFIYEYLEQFIYESVTFYGWENLSKKHFSKNPCWPDVTGGSMSLVALVTLLHLIYCCRLNKI